MTTPYDNGKVYCKLCTRYVELEACETDAKGSLIHSECGMAVRLKGRPYRAPERRHRV